MRFTRWISVAALSLALVLGPAVAAGAQSYEAEELKFLELINAYRQENGLEPLLLSAPLSVAAERHSEDMGTYGFFSHTTEASSYYPVGSGHPERIAQEGYDYNTYTAENVAYGQTSAEEVFEAWRISPGHNVNMLGDYQVIGIGLAWVNGTPYWTTVFGAYVDPSASGGSPGATPVAGSNATTPETEPVRDTVAPRAAGERASVENTNSPTGEPNAAGSQYAARDQYNAETGSRTPPEDTPAAPLQAAPDQYDQETAPTPGDTGDRQVAQAETTQPEEPVEEQPAETASAEVASESASGSSDELPSEEISMLPDTGGLPLTAFLGGAALLLIGGRLARGVFRAE